MAIKFGNASISKIYLGSNEISKAQQVMNL